MARHGIPRRGDSDRGAVAVEFALVLPVLVVLVFGIIDFGRLYNAQVTLTQAAREGSRLAALNLPNVAQRTADSSSGLVTSSAVQVTACPANADQTSDAKVTVTYNFAFNTPMISLVGLPTTMVLTGTGIMPCSG